MLLRDTNHKKASNRPCKLGLDPNNKVDVPKSVACLNVTLIFGWCLVRRGSKDGCQKDHIHLKKIGLYAQNMITIIDLIVNKTGETYMTT